MTDLALRRTIQNIIGEALNLRLESVMLLNLEETYTVNIDTWELDDDGSILSYARFTIGENLNDVTYEYVAERVNYNGLDGKPRHYIHRIFSIINRNTRVDIEI